MILIMKHDADRTRSPQASLFLRKWKIQWKKLFGKHWLSCFPSWCPQSRRVSSIICSSMPIRRLRRLRLARDLDCRPVVVVVCACRQMSVNVNLFQNNTPLRGEALRRRRTAAPRVRAVIRCERLRPSSNKS